MAFEGNFSLISKPVSASYPVQSAWTELTEVVLLPHTNHCTCHSPPMKPASQLEKLSNRKNMEYLPAPGFMQRSVHGYLYPVFISSLEIGLSITANRKSQTQRTK